MSNFEVAERVRTLSFTKRSSVFTDERFVLELALIR
jgi:hypothetical protein